MLPLSPALEGLSPTASASVSPGWSGRPRLGPPQRPWAAPAQAAGTGLVPSGGGREWLAGYFATRSWFKPMAMVSKTASRSEGRGELKNFAVSVAQFRSSVSMLEPAFKPKATV